MGNTTRSREPQCAHRDDGNPVAADSGNKLAVALLRFTEDEIAMLDRDRLRALQAPLKERYSLDPSSALVTLRAEGALGENVTCSIATGRTLIEAGLHPATGGTGLAACSGDMLLQALVACAGVTFSAVATALGIEFHGGRVIAEGDLDFRGTLAVAKDAPVGFQQIRLRILADTNATADEQEKLLQLTERYCVVYQTLRNGAQISLSL
jgi:uncharacterized OsmC-like protein